MSVDDVCTCGAREYAHMGMQHDSTCPVVSTAVPDYSGEVAEPSEPAMQRLNKLVLAQVELELRVDGLKADLKDAEHKLREYREKLVPQVMQEIGMTKIVTNSGVQIELKEEVRGAFPKDDEKRAAAFRFLEEQGDDGMIKREFTIRYGRDSTEWAREFHDKLQEMGVEKHATVEEDWSINHQTMLAYLRKKLAEGAPVPMESFGAFVQSFARVKIK